MFTQPAPPSCFQSRPLAKSEYTSKCRTSTRWTPWKAQLSSRTKRWSSLTSFFWEPLSEQWMSFTRRSTKITSPNSKRCVSPRFLGLRWKALWVVSSTRFWALHFCSGFRVSGGKGSSGAWWPLCMRIATTRTTCSWKRARLTSQCSETACTTTARRRRTFISRSLSRRSSSPTSPDLHRPWPLSRARPIWALKILKGSRSILLNSEKWASRLFRGWTVSRISLSTSKCEIYSVR